MKQHFLTALMVVASTTTLQAQVADSPIDVTPLVANAACQNAPGWIHHAGEKAGTAGSNYAKNVPLFNSADYSGTGIESWTSTPTTNTTLIYQDVSLPAGTYQLEACVVAQVYVSDSRAGANDGGISLFMGDSHVTCTSNQWQRLTLTLQVPQTQRVRIGVRSEATNQNTWIAIADVHLRMVGAAAANFPRLSLDERMDTYPTGRAMLADLLLRKHFPADRFVTLCLPVSMPRETLQATFQEVRTITAATPNGDRIDITTMPSDSIVAGKVYLVRGRNTGSALLPLGVNLLTTTAPADVSIGAMTLRGTYRTREHIENAYIPNADGTAFVPATGRGRILGYGAYIVKP